MWHQSNRSTNQNNKKTVLRLEGRVCCSLLWMQIINFSCFWMFVMFKVQWQLLNVGEPFPCEIGQFFEREIKRPFILNTFFVCVTVSALQLGWALYYIGLLLPEYKDTLACGIQYFTGLAPCTRRHCVCGVC